jgi:hypothetical protein
VNGWCRASPVRPRATPSIRAWRTRPAPVTTSSFGDSRASTSAPSGCFLTGRSRASLHRRFLLLRRARPTSSAGASTTPRRSTRRITSRPCSPTCAGPSRNRRRSPPRAEDRRYRLAMPSSSPCSISPVDQVRVQHVPDHVPLIGYPYGVRKTLSTSSP